MNEISDLPRIISLPGSLINQIAAGEVIERPSSVVKELIENAIDAGATKIEIDIENGGTDKIIISDNGCGIHPDDMELAILRHSTSKISSQQDLITIASLGFRGEALSSIASVSDFCITSRTESEENGSKLKFNPYNSRVDVIPAARGKGTTIEVYKLFQPVPARRKFLRSAKTEFIHIQEIIKRFALNRFDIEFLFYHNGKLILNCQTTGKDYKYRLATIFGSKFFKNAWHIDSRIEDFKLWGWLGGEYTARSQSDRQYLYLNNRIIKDKHINHAIRKVMNNIIPDSRYPSYALHLFLDPSSVDVNVHPTKQQVRFKFPRNIHDFVFAVLSEAVREKKPQQVGNSFGENNPGYTPYRMGEYNRADVNIHELKSLYSTSAARLSEHELTSNPFGIPFTVLHNQFVLARYQDDIRVIDYKNLKRHYLFSCLSDELLSSNIVQRPLLVPVMLSYTAAELIKLISYQELLNRLGILLTQSGPLTLSIRSIPSLTPDLDISDFFLNFIKLMPKLKQLETGIEKELLRLLVDMAAYNDSYQYSLKEIHEDLILIGNLNLPFSDRKYVSLWNTVSVADLSNLVDSDV